MRRNLGYFLALALCSLMLPGCQTDPPIGNSDGRIDPHDHEAYTGQVPISGMLEFGDQTAMALARDITSIREIANSPKKCVLELGTIVNHTSSPSSDFEMLQKRLRSQIINSDVKNQMMITESADRTAAEMTRLYGQPQPDLLQQGDNALPIAQYDPNITYFLQGDFYQTDRGGKQYYYLEFHLENLGNRQIGFTKHYDLAYGH